MTDAQVVRYPKIRNLSYIENDIPPDAWVVVQEKIDGSNVAIRRVGDGFVLQSRETIINPFAPGMFAPFVRFVESHPAFASMFDGEIVYGEMAQNQGKIKYAEKFPFIGFDSGHVVQDGSVRFSLSVAEMASLDVPVVETVAEGHWSAVRLRLPDLFAALGDTHEGLVVKAYNVTTRWHDPETGDSGEVYHPLLAGKLVREAFAEARAMPSSLKKVNDPLDQIAEMFVTPARVLKAVQRLRERGEDITKGHLVIREVHKDTHDEDAEQIAGLLFKANWKQIASKMAPRVIEQHAKTLDTFRVAA